MSVNLFARSSKSLLFQEYQIYQKITNKIWTNSNRVIHNNLLKSQLKAIVPSIVQSVNTDTLLTTGKNTCCIANFQRLSSKESYEDIPICLSELRSLLKNGNAVLIDVRTERETWRSGVLPGSICVPLHQLDEALKMAPEDFLRKYCNGKPTKDKTIIFVCQRGSRSFHAAKKARQLGYESVHSVQGGFVKWFDRQRKIREYQDQAKECESD
ncbi:uncharacterized protein LOC128985595 isoform X1 [Macrosteles quadrilineatus]|uniref:uncharacterized protein LOC128985595 isoform X1 n=1 Tax=Macrosteles quadrilineatus TaxID=74068 RepID=UPI0023E1B565|nr:uncharacterized protein LOC128985595 isoform X1 [Macrosteles quadrilineatus]